MPEDVLCMRANFLFIKLKFQSCIVEEMNKNILGRGLAITSLLHLRAMLYISSLVINSLR